MTNTELESPLRGLSVVELHAIGPVPFAGMLLQKLGASVTRVVPTIDPLLGTQQLPEYDVLNLDKSVVHINLKSGDGLNKFHTLLQKSDVLLEGFRPGVLERLSLEPKAIAKQQPHLIIGRLNGYGKSGPYAQRAGHDINYLALSGVLHSIGEPQAPIVPLNLIGDFGGGAMHILVGVLAQLVRRSLDKDRKGAIVETSILAGTIGLTPMIYGMIAENTWHLERCSNLLDGGAPFYRTYQTSDKQRVAVGALEKKFFNELLNLLELNDSVDASVQYDREYWPKLTALFTASFESATRDHWSSKALKFDCCVTPVLNFLESSTTEQSSANHWFTHTPFTHPDRVIDFTSLVSPSEPTP